VKFVSGEVDAPALGKFENDFDAIFLGVGLGAMRQLEIGPTAPEHVVDALRFIAGYKTGLRHSAPARVVVIGAGNTAIDAACAAKRLGANRVTVLYRRTREDISAFDFEYEHALNEGVEFRWSILPQAIEESRGAVQLRCVMTRQDEAGRVLPLAGSNFIIECDLLIPAIGQSPLLELLSQLRGVTLSHGRVVIDRLTGQTTNPKYFAGGDCVNGGREVVDAVADGKRAALGIAAALSKQKEALLG
jgi:glutamate synthase (NADPH/NADH) small chain